MIICLLNLNKLTTFLIIIITLCISCNAHDKQIDQTIALDAMAENNAIVLRTTREGMYRIPLSDIGWNYSNQDSIALTNRGE
jgi:hypothetical protein